MARRVWGSIAQKSKGVWEIRYPKPPCPETGRRRQGSQVVRGSRKDAEGRLAELYLTLGSSPAGQDMTVDQYWRLRYWPDIEGLAPSTRCGYRSIYRSNIKPAFGERPLRAITGEEVQRWLNGMTYGAARSARAVLRAMLSHAQVSGDVGENVLMRRYRMPKEPAGTAKRTVNKGVYSAAELEALFADAHGEVWEGPGILAAFGSACREEACGARLDEIGFEDVMVEGRMRLFATYRIARTVQHLEGRLVVREGMAKNDARVRWLIVAPPHSLRLRAIVRQGQEEGRTYLLDDGFGGLMNPNTMTAAYRRWFLGRAHRYIPFNNLRNSYGTVMHSLGLDLAMVGKLMGHTQQSTTYKFYDRPGKDELIGAVASVLQVPEKRAEM
ncbi:MAG: site-specific integrase [Coriobacteriaceae bacterium]|jgi:integrase|nr:site-specific integrase [Coriobacteriaceae bacterium]